MSSAGRMRRVEFSGKLVSPKDAEAECYKHDYLAVGELKINGKVVAPDGPIDKEALGPRKLLQMYNRRLIKLAAESEVKLTGVKPSAKPAAIGPTDLFNPGKCGHQVVPIASAPPKTSVTRVASKRSMPRVKSKRAA